MLQSLLEVAAHDEPAGVLRRVFGFPRFRGQQEEVVRHVVAGGDALVLAPTGGGKSICYQVPALCRRGTAVVISPLIALMDDQVAALRQLGVAAGALHSELDPAEARAITRDLIEQQLDLLYVSPERLLAQRHDGSAVASASSRCSPSTRRIASRNGATSSGRNTARSPAWRNASPACRASR